MNSVAAHARRRRWTFVLVSVGGHALLALLLAEVRPLPPRQSRPIEIAIVERAAPPKEPVAAPIPEPTPEPAPEPIAKPAEPIRAPKPGERATRPATPSSPRTGAEPSSSPSTQAPTNAPVAPPTPATPTPAPRIDLFDPNAIRVAVPSLQQAPKRTDLGTTLRAGDGVRDPNARDHTGDGEDASGRLHEWFAEAASEQRVKNGQVAPRWREAEREAKQRFHPSPELVSSDGRLGNMLKQWANSTPHGGQTPRGVDDSRRDPLGGGFLGGGTMGAASEMKDSMRTRTVVEVVVDADGAIVSAKVVLRSGRRKFDEEALRAVRHAVEGGGPLGGQEAPANGVVTRWAVEAWVEVTPLLPTAGFSFDESTGKVGGSYPMKQGVQTRVALISVRPRS